MRVNASAAHAPHACARTSPEGSLPHGRGWGLEGTAGPGSPEMLV